MRITNKVMQNNALTNINRNKELQDSLTTQLSTGKKVYKPSDDPVTAIRALRLRSDVNQVSQFYKKNVPDAESWLELTESSVKTTVSVVTDMIKQCEKGANDTLTTSDRQTIINSLKQLREEVYSTGNADFAGRYIFTGYRTDTPLTFKEDADTQYTITEVLKPGDLKESTYISTGGTSDLLSLNETDFDGAKQVVEQDIESLSFYRYRLAYDTLDDVDPSYELKDKDGNAITGTSITKYTDAKQAYKDAANATGDEMFFCTDTGEVLLSESLYNKIKSGDATLEFTYDKSKWNKGELMPQHYFPTIEHDTTTTPATEIKYNYDKDSDTIDNYIKNGLVDQPIEYQVGFDQHIRVNTSADEIFQHGIGRDVDELINLAEYLDKGEAMQSKLEGMSKDTTTYSAAQLEDINRDLDAANKAVTLLKDQLQKSFSKNITNMQGYLDSTNEAISLIGNRSARLSLIDNRLASQTTTFKTLQSENEDADATEVAVQLSSAQVSYQAALMATSDMIKETLLNYL